MEKKLPKGWVEAALLNVSDVYTGKKDANYASKNGKYKFFTCAYLPLTSDDYSYEGDVLILPGNGANVGEVFYYSGKFEAYQRTYIVDNIKIEPKYLYYHMKKFWRERGTSQQYGSATNYIKIGNFKDYFLELPPLAEQKRIILKLDEVFGYLESLKTRLDTIPELIKNFRQAVLTQAVTGKLTEEWRVGKDIGDWKKQKLSDFSNTRLGKMLDKAKNTGEETLYLRNINIRWFDIDFSDLNIMKVENYELIKFTLEKGDVLVCEGGEPGRAALWESDRKDIIFQKALHRVRLKDNVLPKYFLYNLRIDTQNEKIKDLFTGTTIKHLTGKSFSNYTISVPTLKEQTEIVSRVESLFINTDNIEAQYQTLKQKIDNLPQAILAKAFKGELVEQLATDQSAEDLLQEIMALKVELGGKKKGKSSKPKKYKVGEKISIAAEKSGVYGG